MLEKKKYSIAINEVMKLQKNKKKNEYKKKNIPAERAEKQLRMALSRNPFFG
jgi:hypothetical protein